MLRLNPNSSQRELVRGTGIDQATISAVVNQLEEAGLVERSTKPSRGRVGRPEDALSIAPDAGLLIGASLEPDIIRLIATALDGTPLLKLRVPGSRDTSLAIKTLRRGVEVLAAQASFPLSKVRGIGVGVPAVMGVDGRVIFAPNLEWHQVPLATLLAGIFDVPVYTDNDTNAAALAEKLFGSCRDVSDFIYITGHSGIGGGLFLGGNLYRGANGYGGEIGHMKVVPAGRACACGQRGCLEAYVSESSLLKRLAEVGITLPDIVGVVQEATRGNEIVLALLGETGEYLGLAIANLVNLTNPQLVVLGGALAIAASYLLPVIEQVVRRNAMTALTHSARVVVSPLGAESVPMGGIALALEGLLAEPGWFSTSDIDTRQGVPS